jgi:hypothetical protein
LVEAATVEAALEKKVVFEKKAPPEDRPRGREVT